MLHADGQPADRDRQGCELDDPTHDGSKLEIAEGALGELRALHEERARLANHTPVRGPALRRRLLEGWRRARANGSKLHRYPRGFLRGFRRVRPNDEVARKDVDRLEDLIEARRYDRATELGAALLPAKEGDRAFLAAASKAFGQAGAVSLQARAVQARRRSGDSAALRRKERMLLGTLLETSDGWLPRVPPGISLHEAPKPDRILHLLKVSMPHRQSGYTMRSQYVVNGQSQVGLDPVAMTPLGFPRLLGATEVDPVETVDGIAHHRLDTRAHAVLNGPADIYLQSYAEDAAARVAEVSPSVIHAHSGHRGYEAALVGLALARHFGLPMVYEVRGFFESLWGSDPEWSEAGELYLRRFETETRCMKEADAVITLSKTMADEIADRGIAPERIHVIPNGVDVDRFFPQERPRGLVARLGLEESFVFGYVSNLDHWREGQETLIRAAARLRARGIPAVALIVGDGKRRKELEDLASGENADGVVVFTGQVPHDEVLDYYRLMDVFVVPRVPERAARLVTPLKPLEAMAAGVPLVVSDLAALQEIIGHGERGQAFTAGDATSLAETLSRLYENPDARHDLAERARRWVTGNRQWAAAGERNRLVYEGLASS